VDLKLNALVVGVGVGEELDVLEDGVEVGHVPGQVGCYVIDCCLCVGVALVFEDLVVIVRVDFQVQRADGFSEWKSALSGSFVAGLVQIGLFGVLEK